MTQLNLSYTATNQKDTSSYWSAVHARLGILRGTMHSTQALGVLYHCQHFQQRCRRENINQREMGLRIIESWQREHLSLLKRHPQGAHLSLAK